MNGVPKVLVALGIVLILVGALWARVPRLFGWFGHLPGDLRFEGRGGVVFVPLASMLLVSVAGSAALNLLAWVLRRLP